MENTYEGHVTTNMLTIESQDSVCWLDLLLWILLRKISSKFSGENLYPHAAWLVRVRNVGLVEAGLGLGPLNAAAGCGRVLCCSHYEFPISNYVNRTIEYVRRPTKTHEM